MDKEAQEALQKLQESGLEEKLGLSVTVKAFIFRQWWVDETQPDKIRWFFLDGVSQDSNGKPFFVRAWWPIPLEDLSLFEKLEQIPVNSIMEMTSDTCTLESAEDFSLEGKTNVDTDGNSLFCLCMKTPNLFTNKGIC